MFLNVITEEQIRRDCPHNAPLTLRAFNKISPRQFNTSVSALNPYEIPRYAPKTVGQFAKALVSQQRGITRQVTNALAVAETQQAILAETEAKDFVMDVVEEKGGDGDEDQKKAPGEMSMAEIDEQIEIYTDMLSEEALTGEEINAALLTLKYYEQLRGEKLSTMSDAELGEELQKTRNVITPIVEERDEAPILDIISRDEEEMREGRPKGVSSAFLPYDYFQQPSTRRKKSEMTEARAMGAEDTRTIERKEAKKRRKEERREKTAAAAAAENPPAAEDLPTVPSYQGLRGVTSGERESDDELKKRSDDIQSVSVTVDPIHGPSSYDGPFSYGS